MEFRNICISNPAKISISKNQLVIEQEEKVTIPAEDICILLIESPEVIITSYTLAFLSELGVPVFFCDRTHLPDGVLLPFVHHSRHLKMLKSQIDLKQPLRKQLWATIVKQKILNQALCLEYLKLPNQALIDLSKKVRSGDPDNIEAQAAQIYFPALMGSGFSRGLDCFKNGCLNYGYAIIRGMIGRNLVMYGFEPSLGLHHHSELNSFNLADDLIEPFRPVVDLWVQSQSFTGDELTRENKLKLLTLPNVLVNQGNKNYRVSSAIEAVVMSFARSLKENKKLLELPELIPPEVFSYA